MKTRPYVVLLVGFFTAALISCGGSGGGNNLAEGGIGGTGISNGPITGFGSIFVNGIEYDISSATLLRDGATVSAQNEYSIGEYVSVSGTINADGRTGTATQVVFSDILEGPVTVASTDNATVTIMGQTVRTDKLTVLIGFSLLSDLATGNMVEVSGVRNTADEIVASAIKLKSAAFIPGTSQLDISDTITSINYGAQTFQLGGLTISYGSASFSGVTIGTLAAGQFVEVTSTQPLAGSTITASTIQLENQTPTYSENTELELEGIITRFASSSDFDVNGITVSTSGSTEFEDGTLSGLAAGARVEVEGTVNSSSVLVAKEVSLREAGSTIELQDTIDTISPITGQLTLLGNTVIINSATMLIDNSAANIEPLTLNNLNTGDLIEVYGNILSTGDILAVRIDREDPAGGSTPNTELEGIATAKDSVAGTLTVLGATVITNGSTSFVDHSDNPISSAAFFALVTPGSSKVHLLGNVTGSNQVTATWIKVEG